MADLNIPNLNKRTDKYLFKKKLTLKRKSKKRLLSESFFMFSMSILLIYINYLIPNKTFLFTNLMDTFKRTFLVINDLFSYLYQIFLVVFILVSIIISIVLLLGSFYRIIKVIKRKSKQIPYK